MIFIIIGVVVVMYAITFSLCVVAGRADRALERQHEQYLRDLLRN